MVSAAGRRSQVLRRRDVDVLGAVNCGHYTRDRVSSSKVQLDFDSMYVVLSRFEMAWLHCVGSSSYEYDRVPDCAVNAQRYELYLCRRRGSHTLSKRKRDQGL